MFTTCRDLACLLRVDSLQLRQIQSDFFRRRRNNPNKPPFIFLSSLSPQQQENMDSNADSELIYELFPMVCCAHVPFSQRKDHTLRKSQLKDHSLTNFRSPCSEAPRSLNKCPLLTFGQEGSLHTGLPISHIKTHHKCDESFYVAPEAAESARTAVDTRARFGRARSS